VHNCENTLLAMAENLLLLKCNYGFIDKMIGGM